MSGSRVRLLSALTTVMLLATAGDRTMAWPSLPGVPGVPTVKQAAKGVLSNELLKEFGTWFNYNRPVYVSGNDVLPTVPTLPGGPWHPVSLVRELELVKPSHAPVVHLPPGDYNVAVVTYCMGHNNQGPWRNKFLLAPVKGAWADILDALNYRAYGSPFAAPEIQGVSWAMQAGMSYDEMSPAQKHIVDVLLPDYKSRLHKDFYDSARDEWNALASKVPGTPTFEAALGRLGDVGKALLAIENAREQIISDGNNFNAMVAQFAHVGQLRPSDVLSSTPWSIVAPGVYARLRTRGTLLTPGVLQIRITAQAAYRSFELASTQLRGLGGGVASLLGGFSLPWNLAGFLNNGTQPLSSSPNGGAPDPSQSDGGNDNQPNFYAISSSWHRRGGSNGSNAGKQNNGSNNGSNNNGSNNGSNSNNGNNNDNNDDNNDNGSNSGGNANNGSHGNPVSSTNQGHTSVELAPCDPPGNTFGVAHGVVVASTSTSLTVGRGTGSGIVCLLLRPYVQMSALGLAGGTASVSSGNASYNLPNAPIVPGHVVIVARYVVGGCLTPLVPKGPVPPCTITAVIDFAGVGPFCPDLVHTIALGKAPLGDPASNWLSSASLENRLCITTMLGPTLRIQAWVAATKVFTPTTPLQAVDPQNFVYDDAWGHM
jgi:hypothetical protein